MWITVDLSVLECSRGDLGNSSAPYALFDGLRRKHIICAATRRRRQGALFRERPLHSRAAGGSAPRPLVLVLHML